MTGIDNKFNKDIQLFSPEQVSRIYQELDIAPAKPKPKPAKPSQPDPAQSVEDILKNNFIEEEEPSV